MIKYFPINNEWINTHCKCKAIFLELGLPGSDYNWIKPLPYKRHGEEIENTAEELGFSIDTDS